MLAYIIGSNGELEQVDDLTRWASWYFAHKDELIIGKDDIRDKRGKFVMSVITRFRGQVGPLADPSRPLVWVTEGTDGSFFGAVCTRTEAKDAHKRIVRVIKDKYKR